MMSNLRMMSVFMAYLELECLELFDGNGVDRCFSCEELLEGCCCYDEKREGVDYARCRAL